MTGLKSWLGSKCMDVAAGSTWQAVLVRGGAIASCLGGECIKVSNKTKTLGGHLHENKAQDIHGVESLIFKGLSSSKQEMILSAIDKMNSSTHQSLADAAATLHAFFNSNDLYKHHVTASKERGTPTNTSAKNAEHGPAAGEITNSGAPISNIVGMSMSESALCVHNGKYMINHDRLSSVPSEIASSSKSMGVLAKSVPARVERLRTLCPDNHLLKGPDDPMEGSSKRTFQKSHGILKYQWPADSVPYNGTTSSSDISVDFDVGTESNLDAKLALAAQMSMDEEKARQDKAAKAVQDIRVSTLTQTSNTPATSAETISDNGITVSPALEPVQSIATEPIQKTHRDHMFNIGWQNGKSKGSERTTEEVATPKVQTGQEEASTAAKPMSAASPKVAATERGSLLQLFSGLLISLPADSPECKAEATRRPELSGAWNVNERVRPAVENVRGHSIFVSRAMKAPHTFNHGHYSEGPIFGKIWGAKPHPSTSFSPVAAQAVTLSDKAKSKRREDRVPELGEQADPASQQDTIMDEALYAAQEASFIPLPNFEPRQCLPPAPSQLDTTMSGVTDGPQGQGFSIASGSESLATMLTQPFVNIGQLQSPSQHAAPGSSLQEQTPQTQPETNVTRSSETGSSSRLSQGAVIEPLSMAQQTGTSNQDADAMPSADEIDAFAAIIGQDSDTENEDGPTQEEKAHDKFLAQQVKKEEAFDDNQNSRGQWKANMKKKNKAPQEPQSVPRNKPIPFTMQAQNDTGTSPSLPSPSQEKQEPVEDTENVAMVDAPLLNQVEATAADEENVTMTDAPPMPQQFPLAQPVQSPQPPQDYDPMDWE